MLSAESVVELLGLSYYNIYYIIYIYIHTAHTPLPLKVGKRH